MEITLPLKTAHATVSREFDGLPCSWRRVHPRRSPRDLPAPLSIRKRHPFSLVSAYGSFCPPTSICYRFATLVFSSPYKSPFPQVLSFHNHLRCRGCGVTDFLVFHQSPITNHKSLVFCGLRTHCHAIPSKSFLFCFTVQKPSKSFIYRSYAFRPGWQGQQQNAHSSSAYRVIARK